MQKKQIEAELFNLLCAMRDSRTASPRLVRAVERAWLMASHRADIRAADATAK